MSITKAEPVMFRPISRLLNIRATFVALTSNRRIMAFNERLVDEWLIDKYQLTHFLMLKLPPDGLL